MEMSPGSGRRGSREPRMPPRILGYTYGCAPGYSSSLASSARLLRRIHDSVPLLTVEYAVRTSTSPRRSVGTSMSRITASPLSAKMRRMCLLQPGWSRRARSVSVRVVDERPAVDLHDQLRARQADHDETRPAWRQVEVAPEDGIDRGAIGTVR